MAGLDLAMRAQPQGARRPSTLRFELDRVVDVDGLLADATAPNAPTAADFDHPVFKNLLNNVAQDPGLTNTTKVSSVINLARDLADADLNDNAPQQLWQVIFGDDSLYRLLGAELDFNNQPYRMHVVEDIEDVQGTDSTFNLRKGGYI